MAHYESDFEPLDAEIPGKHAQGAQSSVRVFGLRGSESDIYAPYKTSKVHSRTEPPALSNNEQKRAASGKKRRKHVEKPVARAPAVATSSRSTVPTNFDDIAKLVAVIDEQRVTIAKLKDELRTSRIVAQRQEKAIQQLNKDQNDFPRLYSHLNTEIRGLKLEKRRDRANFEQLSHNAQSQVAENVRLRALVQKLQSENRDLKDRRKASVANEEVLDTPVAVNSKGDRKPTQQKAVYGTQRLPSKPQPVLKAKSEQNGKAAPATTQAAKPAPKGPKDPSAYEEDFDDEEPSDEGDGYDDDFASETGSAHSGSDLASSFMASSPSRKSIPLGTVR
ncbi:uncharacterized protein EV422DRAFT_17594 [Fimicolochytrium jonesii]|uniref:uncharacterized protein n=1 Tax=Fimicolochytrium jonesii TaxID=1396493 RepID=UPI0022FF02D5|nr:uncharacterized protein EV422DRAFT_17594 [Fimicolochytrium jonesii]KAI8826921.1 hypothetical protein EV422DRAFT_17594 [Fimicolochytrium jonesii]